MSEAIKEWKESVLANYIKKNGENSINESQVEHIIDWLKSPEASRFLPRIKRISVPQALEHAEKWVVQLNKKASTIEDLEGTEVVHSWDNGFRVVKILSFKAYEREGKIMGHCVARYHAIDGTEIYSLRDEKNDPHCTIELRETENFQEKTILKKIKQIKGKQNKRVDEKYHYYVLDFLNKSKVKIDGYDTHDLNHIDATVIGRNVFIFDRETETTLSLNGDVVWDKVIDQDIDRPAILKINGNFEFKNCYTKASYALFDEIHVGGDLLLENISNLQRLANKVFIDGDVELVDCSAFLKLGDEVYIGGHANASDCKELKCFGNSGLINKDLTVVDCKNFQKKITQQIIGEISID